MEPAALVSCPCRLGLLGSPKWPEAKLNFLIWLASRLYSLPAAEGAEEDARDGATAPRPARAPGGDGELLDPMALREALGKTGLKVPKPLRHRHLRSRRHPPPAPPPTRTTTST